MECFLLTPNKYSNPIDLCSDSTGSLEFSAPHCLWNSNLTAASQLWALEFIATRTRIFIVDISYKGTGKIVNQIDLVPTPPQVHADDPWWNTAPRGVSYLRIATFLGREILLATTNEGQIFMWRTLALREGSLKPCFQYDCGISTWGIDVHSNLPLLAFSNNSGRITVLELDPTNPDCLEVDQTSISSNLGGNIPSICFIGDYIGYTTLTLDLLAGSFGVLTLALESKYTIKMQQAGWCIKPLDPLDPNLFLKTSKPYDLCGSDTSPGELDLVECVDTCHVSFALDYDDDRLGLQSRWVQPQTWVKEQQTQLREWVKHGRRKPLSYDTIKDLENFYFVVTTSTHGFLVDASTGLCLASAQRALMPTGIPPGPEFAGYAISIVEIIQPLGVAILVSRASMVVFIRFTQDLTCKAFRQELVLCDFNDFVVGLSCCPVRAHDFEYDLRTLDMSTEPHWKNDVPDKSLGDVGTYLVRLHTFTGKVEAFFLTASTT